MRRLRGAVLALVVAAGSLAGAPEAGATSCAAVEPLEHGATDLEGRVVSVHRWLDVPSGPYAVRVHVDRVLAGPERGGVVEVTLTGSRPHGWEKVRLRVGPQGDVRYDGGGGPCPQASYSLGFDVPASWGGARLAPPQVQVAGGAVVLGVVALGVHRVRRRRQRQAQRDAHAARLADRAAPGSP